MDARKVKIGNTGMELEEYGRNLRIRGRQTSVEVEAADLQEFVNAIAWWQAPTNLPPIPMRLVCEGCGELHIDEGEFATKPHHTHSCQFCGMTWRPAVVPTVGVRFLPGFKNDSPTPKGAK